MSLKDKLKGVKLKGKGRTAPLWEGPSGAGENGGVTFSMLSRFLTCRERFRVAYVVGLKPGDRFNHRIEYGQMWHVCEEEHANGVTLEVGFFDRLTEYCQDLYKKYPLAREQIQHWYSVCRIQFPAYVAYWEKHNDVKDRTPLLQEQTFDVHYTLPSGRVVRLRGKWDAVDLIGKGKEAGVFLQENKTKGDVDEEALRRQLSWDLQTMLYLTTLEIHQKNVKDYLPLLRPDFNATAYARHPIRGVRYNVVRRPLSGGKGTIVQRKATDGAKCPKCKGEGGYQEKYNPLHRSRCLKCNGVGRVGGKPEETSAEYYARLRGIIEAEPEHYFMRWKTEVTPGQVARFRRETLDPILMQLVSWYDGIKECMEGGYDPFSVSNPVTDEHGWHWRHPFGCVNTVDEYGSTDLDAYLDAGDTVGLVERGRLFEELQ